MKSETAENRRTTTPAATTIHLLLQGKGGVGKSFVASILAQYFASRRLAVNCIDTDPINATLAKYPAFSAQRLELMRDTVIDTRVFDDLSERVLTEEGIFVIDSGASTFVPLWNYIVESNFIETLKAAQRILYIHTVITGGLAMPDTLDGFRKLAATTEERNIIVWLNEYFGPIEGNGKKFEEMAVFQEYGHRVVGSIGIAKRTGDTFGRDVEQMIMSQETFEQAIGPGKHPIMMKQRLRMLQRHLFEQLDRLALT